jgi:hypothetical protein
VKQNAHASSNRNAFKAAWCCAWQRSGTLNAAERRENAGFCGGFMVFEKIMVTRMRGIAKIVQHGRHFAAAWVEQRADAHLTFTTQRVLEKARFAVWRGALKIRVSVVRFRPRPPNQALASLLLGLSSFCVSFPSHWPDHRDDRRAPSNNIDFSQRLRIQHPPPPKRIQVERAKFSKSHQL